MSTFRVIRPADRSPDTASGAMRREAAVSSSMVGAGALWFGYVELATGARSAVHHHGESESVIYVISGHARFWAGPGLSEAHDAEGGDFVWVPPYEVHVESIAATPSPSAWRSPARPRRRSSSTSPTTCCREMSGT